MRRLRDEAARIARLEPTHFSRRFKDVVGVTFASWSRAVRVDVSCQLLLATDRQVQDIAVAVGYANLTTFERVFRRMTGLAPSEYRANARRDPRHAEEIPPNAERNPPNAERNPPNAELGGLETA